MRKTGASAVLVSILFAAFFVGCADDGVAPGGDLTALVSVEPAGGSVGVAVGATATVAFDHPVAEGMEAYMALHEGSISDPVVPGTWSRADGGKVLTFTPAAPLKPSTAYVIHLGGGMMSADGGGVDLETHGGMMGGQWATQGMMTGGMDGMGAHMGEGWRHANGSYGMIFTFTTA